MKSTAWYAKKYIDSFGMHVVPVEPKRKFPRAKDWGHKTISDSSVAEKFYTDNPDWNLGVALGPSSMCALDIDDYDSFSLICEAFGFDIESLIKDTPTIRGAGLRLEFKVPEGMDLPYRQLRWRPESDPDGSKHKDLIARAKEAAESGDHDLEKELRQEAKKHALYTVFELRSATDGVQRQNIYPPSIHPDTDKPYTWVTQPRADWPTPPQWLLTIWLEMEKVRPQLLAVCPWTVESEVKPNRMRESRPQYQPGGDNIIQKYNDSISIDQALSNYGYTQAGHRWLSPHSSTQLPGVVLLPDSNKVWIHHASDPLCSEEKGQPVGPFDLMCYYDYGGDTKLAFKAAAESLGIRLGAPQRNDTVVDMDTGEVLHDVPEYLDDMPPPLFDMDPVDTHRAPATISADPVDYYSPLPWTKPKGAPLNHMDNLREIIRRLGVTVRYNVIKKNEEILIPGKKFTVDNKDNASLAWLVSECSVFEFSTGNLSDFITAIADENPYNPVSTWIMSKPWDGQDRLSLLFDTIIVPDPDREPIRDALIRRWMISAVAAAFNPHGVSAHGMLVLQGDQSIGKTSWFKSLVPEDMDVVADGLLLKPDDKDSVKLVVSHWMVELGELDATFRKSDIAALKSFITRDRDEVRLPYARKESKFPRRTVFFGSVNPREYLNDDTGNRRYWTIECEEINHKHGLDMQQIWAEVYELYKQKEQHWLTPEENDALNKINEEYLSIDPIKELILSKLDWEEPEEFWRWEQATNILIECGVDRPNRADARSASAVIQDKNGKKIKRSNGRNLLLCPPKKFS